MEHSQKKRRLSSTLPKRTKIEPRLEVLTFLKGAESHPFSQNDTRTANFSTASANSKKYWARHIASFLKSRPESILYEFYNKYKNDEKIIIEEVDFYRNFNANNLGRCTCAVGGLTDDFEGEISFSEYRFEFQFRKEFLFSTIIIFIPSDLGDIAAEIYHIRDELNKKYPTSSKSHNEDIYVSLMQRSDGDY
jgi:hypothetical protein